METVIAPFLRDLVATFGIVGTVAAPFVLIWIWVTWRTFIHEPGSPDGRKRQAHDLERFRRWIRDRTFKQRYLHLLNGLLGGVTRYLTHDAESLDDPRNAARIP